MKRTKQAALAALMAVTIVLSSPAWVPQAPAAPEAASAPAAKTFSQQDLDQLLAPIALHPDALLAQILMAATYPLEIVQAARWVKENLNLKGKALEDAARKQPWDPAVKALTAVPQVLQQMSDKLDWTQKLGDAFLAQQADVMQTVQNLRAKAYAAGNLKSTEQQAVRTEAQGSQTIYVIESSKPEVVYVPAYNPTVVYGAWWYPYPPYYIYPPHYAYPPGVGFATGVIVGAAIWGNCNWHGNNVNINVNQYNSYNKTNIQNTNFQHNVEHRKGVAYKDQKVAQQYNRGAGAQTAQSREQYRGRTESSGPQAGRDAVSRDQAGASDRAGAGTSPARTSQPNRDFGSSASTRGDAGGFSGAGSGASTRAASSRGSASRGGGGGRSGGGRR